MSTKRAAKKAAASPGLPKGVGFTDEEPPAGRRPPSYDWQHIADLIQSKPGQWYKVFDHDRTSITVALKAGKMAALRFPGIEVRTANNSRASDAEPRMCAAWIRYNPNQE